MDQGAPLTSWPEESLVPGAGEDFSSFLEFDFDLADLENAANRGQQQPGMQSSAPPQDVSAAMQGVDMGMGRIDHSQGASQQQPSTDFDPGYQQMQTVDMQGVDNAQPQVDAQMYYQKHQGGFPQGYAQRRPYIPPTPNSMELHGAAPNCLPQLETEGHRGYEQYARTSEDQSSFTPLISPAMTPLEQQFRLPEYTIPGEYFTPLSSPALEASNSNGNGYPMTTMPPHARQIGFESSPIDMPSQFPSASAPSSPALVRKQRRKPSFSARTPGRLPRQSPSVRPMNARRKPPVGTGIQTNDSAYPTGQDQPSNRLSVNNADQSRNGSSNEGSGQDSVSPESLSEPLMPPPALPRSNPSPNIAAQEAKGESNARAAATPATLMRLQKQSSTHSPETQFSRSGGVIVNDAPGEPMEDICLPEAASSSTQPTFTSGTVVPSNERTPTLSANKTPTLRPNLPGSSSVGPSPQIGAMASPSGPVGIKRADSKAGGRASKKRQSVSSSQASPALMPKISPSIQPLVRGDTVSAETSALYLASKSNYQHILEGTLLPGVSYPEALAENLSSKRTNHKLAEQGRRNRINTALKEIEGLLPHSLLHAKAQESGSPDAPSTNGSGKPEKASSNQSVSKASTVEMAIVYIKALQKELADTKEKLKIAESKLGTTTEDKREKEVDSKEDGGTIEDPGLT